MAYLLTHFWPGGTEEQYRTLLAAASAAGDPPEKVHAAGPTEGGFLIAAIYDSKETSESFVSGTLMPLMPLEGGLVGPPEERSCEIVNSKGI
jgi:hypothetical protein